MLTVVARSNSIKTRVELGGRRFSVNYANLGCLLAPEGYYSIIIAVS